MNAQTQLAQISEVSPELPSVPNYTEWGLVGAVAYLLIKEGFGWFREKEASEDKLVASLIDNQQRVLERLLEVQQSQHKDFLELKQAILGFSDTLQRSVESQNRAIAQIQSQLNSLRSQK